MATEFGLLLGKVLSSMDSESGLDKLRAVMDIYERNLKIESRITKLEALVEKLVDEGCVIAQRFCDIGGQENELYGWDNALDDYKAVMSEEEEDE